MKKAGGGSEGSFLPYCWEVVTRSLLQQTIIYYDWYQSQWTNYDYAVRLRFFPRYFEYAEIQMIEVVILIKKVCYEINSLKSLLFNT